MEVPWVIKDSTKVKHEILEKYISPWMQILFSNQEKYEINELLIYIDGFSGPGIYFTDDNKEETCDGSPLIFADIANKYIEFRNSRQVIMYCIDSDVHCTEKLKERLLKRNSHDQKWEVYCAEFKDKIKDILDEIEDLNLNDFPKFIFIDPFGYTGYPISTLEKLLSYHRTELFINFMIYDVIRFCEYGHSEKILIEQFGTDEFKKVQEMDNSELKQTFLLNLYCRSLKEIAHADYLMPFRVNTPHQGARPRYYLIHASKHFKALQIMKNCMSKVSHAEYRLEAIGVKTPQMSLFEDPEQLKLKDQFREFCQAADQGILFEEIEKWAYINTNGVSKTIKQSLKELEENDIIEINRKKGQKKHTVTDGAHIRYIGT